MATHDPQRAVASLRDHLAAHDTPVAFLFGAGVSSSVNIAEPPAYEALVPAMAALTEHCAGALGELGDPYSAAWGKLQLECEQAGNQFNVESALSRVCGKIDSLGADDTSLGLSLGQLVELDEKLRALIAGKAILGEDSIPAALPHDRFALWTKRAARRHAVEIFTTNYDILIERSLELARVPVFDGFTGSFRPFFNAECIDSEERLPRPETVRLWKIHGSVNWQEVDAPAGKRIVRGEQTDSGKMVFPTQRKYDESRRLPYLALMNRLTRVLSRDAALLVVSGFSFSDEHINAALFDVLDNRPLSHVVALQHEDLSEDSAIVNAGLQRKNLIVLGLNGGVLGGEWGEWRLAEPVDAATHGFMDVVFDSDAVPEPDQVALTGRLRIGDFNRFAAFLSTLAETGSGAA